MLEVIHAETLAGPVLGVITQLGGQTPLGLAQGLKDAGVTLLGTAPEAIHLAEERGAFGEVLEKAGLPSPEHGMATSFEDAREIANRIGYPVLVRPSFVLGGRGMEIVYDETMLHDYLTRAAQVNPEHPVLVDRFLDDAIEIDVDALYDGTELYLGGVMEHIEEAGIHSGDSACSLPPYTLGPAEIERIRTSTLGIAKGVGVRGLLNVQYALANGILYVLEANPRASRTVPFIAKAYDEPYVNYATKVMLGHNKVTDFNFQPRKEGYAIKIPVFSYEKFPDVKKELGPEMKSTGEAIRFIKDLKDPFFTKIYAERNMHLSR